jgi:hypothetical protein
MGKELDKDMLRMMTITERFKYMNDLKKIKMNISQAKAEQNNETCNYSGLPSTESYNWVDEEDSDYDSFSRGDRNDSDGGEDSNEY